jgi:glycosyltransferase involved in cell wall biosynthesis
MNEKVNLSITIVTPSFNQGDYIEETINSVLSQSYPDVEYIVIDGGSKDNTIDIIKKYESGIAYWISEPDNGQSHAINKGLSKMNGQILAYLNSDDVYYKDALEKVARFFNENPNIDVLYGDISLIDKDSKLIKHKYEPPFNLKMAHMIGFGLLIPQPSTFWRKTVTDKIGLFDENNHYTMDQDYWYRASKHFRIKHFPVKLAKFRLHSSSKTNVSIEEKDTPYARRHQADLLRFYNDMVISKFVPFKYSNIIRYLYRFSRVIQKVLRGLYFRRKLE